MPEGNYMNDWNSKSLKPIINHYIFCNSMYGSVWTSVTIYLKRPRTGQYVHIWLNVMRTHIDLNICHFLPSTLRVTEAKKKEIEGNKKSDVFIYVFAPLKMFCFFIWCPNNCRIIVFFSSQYLVKLGPKKVIMNCWNWKKT